MVFRYLLQELMIMIRDKRTECTRLFYDESVKIVEIFGNNQQKGQFMTEKQKYLLKLFQGG